MYTLTGAWSKGLPPLIFNRLYVNTENFSQNNLAVWQGEKFHPCVPSRIQNNVENWILFHSVYPKNNAYIYPQH